MCLVITLEQWNLSAAEESKETSGTNGNGVHHYLRRPRDVVVGALAPVMDLVISRQAPSPFPAGNQPDRTYGSMSTL